MPSAYAGARGKEKQLLVAGCSLLGEWVDICRLAPSTVRMGRRSQLEGGVHMIHRFLDRLICALRFCRDYGTPMRMAWEESRGGQRQVTAVDRESGVACRCRPGARRMFGEVWHERDYDVPKLPVRPGDTVIDVGANQGFFTCYAAWRGARVIALEPDPASRVLLEANVSRNGFAESVRILPWAASGRRGEVRFHASDALGGGMSSICREFISAMRVPVRETIQVRAVTLEDVFEECALGEVRLCKLDCEGAELDIVRSLPARVRSRVHAFVIEYHGNYPLREVVDALLAWDSHAIAFAEPKSYCERNILRAVRRDALRAVEW